MGWLVLVASLACSDYAFHAPDDDVHGPRHPKDDTAETAPPDDTEDTEEPDDPPRDTAGDPDPPDDPCEGQPFDASPGDVVLTEALLDPDAVDDEVGEWVEVWNATACAVDLTGATLADDNVDVAPLEGSLVIAAGGFAVLCAETSRSLNGGVSCDADYYYQGFGGGFALSNEGDEIVLVSARGQVLDRFAYGAGFAPVGVSMGVDPDYATVEDNDRPARWCAQSGRLSGGDQGNPGAENDGCG